MRERERGRERQRERAIAKERAREQETKRERERGRKWEEKGGAQWCVACVVKKVSFFFGRTGSFMISRAEELKCLGSFFFFLRA